VRSQAALILLRLVRPTGSVLMAAEFYAEVAPARVAAEESFGRSAPNPARP